MFCYLDSHLHGKDGEVVDGFPWYEGLVHRVAGTGLMRVI